MDRWFVLPLLLGFLFLLSLDCFADELVLSGVLESGVYSSDSTIQTQGGCLINPGKTVGFEAGIITLKPGFHAQSGSRFEAVSLDGDGLSNACELQYFGDLSHGPEEDFDGDELTNAQECRLGTNPAEGNPDNDADGLPDAWEVQYFGIDLSNDRNGDADGDGISNWVEFKLGTDPTAPYAKGPGIYYEYDELGRIRTLERIPTR